MNMHEDKENSNYIYRLSIVVVSLKYGFVFQIVLSFFVCNKKEICYRDRTMKSVASKVPRKKI